MASSHARLTILSTKLIPPTQRSALVERQRLVSRIERESGQRLILVSAPAGYGKTSLMAQAFGAFSKKRKRISWVSLEENDNDLARFISYIIEAARRSGLVFGQTTHTLLNTGISLPADVLKTNFLNELASLDEEWFLFLDDYHLINDKTIMDLMGTLLLAPLANVHLLVGTRSHNRLPVSRLRGLGQVHEMESSDLTFSAAEIAEFFSRVNGTSINEPQIALLQEGTEGWIASIQMVAIALRTKSDFDNVLSSISGEHKNIGDFLSEEVFKRQPEDIQDFLLATSVLKRLNSELCNAVTGHKNGRAMLDHLEAANLFIFSLDTERNWYRYHHLFSDFLRRRLADSTPDSLLEYHRRASNWLAANGDLTEAIEHAFCARDIERAGELLDAASRYLFATGQTSTLYSFAAQLPDHLLRKLPQLQLELSWEYEIQWNVEQARTALENARAAIQQRENLPIVGSDKQDLGSLKRKLAHRELMLEVFTDHYPAVLELSHAWQTEGRCAEPFMDASVGTVLMMSNRERYVCEGVSQTGETLRKMFLEGAASYGSVFHDTTVGTTFFMRGELDHAQREYERALATAIKLHGERSTLGAMPAAMLSELFYEKNMLSEARRILDEMTETSTEFGFVDNAIARCITSARIARCDGDATEVHAALEAGTHISNKYNFERFGAKLLEERVRYLVADGLTKEAVRLTQDKKYKHLFAALYPNNLTTTTHEALAITHARLCCEQGQYAEAVGLIRKWLSFTRDRRCFKSAIRLAVLLSRISIRAGDTPAAKRYLLDALKMGSPGGFVRSFVDEGNSILTLLGDISSSIAETETSYRTHVDLIMKSFDRQNDVSTAGEVNNSCSFDQIESLSPREIEIMRLTSENRMTQEIAEMLGLTESTVKWYWQRIFSKLGVHRRPHAVRIARRYGLLT